jgi:hypothetical protein
VGSHCASSYRMKSVNDHIGGTNSNFATIGR